MRLYPRSKRMLVGLALHADLSIPEAAKKLGLREHQLRYELDRLRERGILRPVLAIDMFALGWQRAQVFLSVASRSKARRDQLVNRLCAHPRTTFVADTAGEFDLEAVMLVDSVSEIHRVLAEAGGEGVRIIRKALAFHLSLSLFPRKYLYPKAQPEDLTFSAREEPAPIDELDHRLLAEFAADPDLSQRELGQKLGVSIVTVGARLRELKRRGILRGMIWSVRGEALGAQNFTLLVETQGFDRALADDMFAYAKRHPNCTNFRRSIGNWDLEIGVELERTADLLTLKDDLSERFADRIARIQVLNRIAIRKYTHYPGHKR